MLKQKRPEIIFSINLTTQNITQFLTYPALLDEKSLAGVDELVATYPWYAGGQMLLARNLHNLNHLRYPARLKMASAATIDRALLRDFVLVLKEKPNLVSVLKPETIASASETIAPSSETIAPASKTIASASETIASASEIIASASETIEPEAIPFTNQVQQITLPLIPFEPYSQFDFTSELLKLPEIVKEKPQPKPVLNFSKDKMSFADWLKHTKHHAEEPPSEAIIDKFIEGNPRMPRPKQNEFFKPQDAAKRSLASPIPFVTETLANIYEQQGHIEKAILAFENLSVKHPEKSSYFAARILTLKERIKD